MKNAFVFGCLIAIVSVTAAKTPEKSCETRRSDIALSAPLSIREIERKELKAVKEMSKIRPDIPQLPFGFANPDWVIFKKKVRPRDRIVQYSTDERSFRNLAGEAGYALIRNNCVVDTFVTMKN